MEALSEGTVIGSPLQEGTVVGGPPRGRGCRRPPQGAAGLPGPATWLYFTYLRGKKSPNASCSARFSCSS